MTERLVINTPGYESHEEEFVFMGDAIRVQLFHVTSTESESTILHSREGTRTVVEIVDASDPNCRLEMEETRSVTIPPEGYVEFPVTVKTIGRSFRIHARTIDGRLSCESCRTYRVIWAKLHVDNIRDIPRVFCTKDKRNYITVDVSIRDKRGNVMESTTFESVDEENMLLCSAQCSSINIFLINPNQEHRFINGKCTMRFRMGPLEMRAKPQVVVRIVCPTQCSGIGPTELPPMTVMYRLDRSRTQNDENLTQENGIRHQSSSSDEIESTVATASGSNTYHQTFSFGFERDDLSDNSFESIPSASYGEGYFTMEN